LERASLLDPEPGLDRELVLVLAEDVLHAAIARVLEELHRALADAADEQELLLVRERLRLARRRVDPLLTEGLHRALGGLADLARVLGADALDRADLLLARLGDLFEGTEAHAVHVPRDLLADAFDAPELADGLFLHL